MKRKRLVIIDGKSVFYRGYYAMKNLSLKNGQPIGGVYGFATLSFEVINKLKPDYIAIAWDKSKTNIRRRRKIYSDYKANRKPAPPDFYEQIPLLYDFLKAMNWPLYELDDYEADDIMGCFAKQAEKDNIEACLITSDLDVLQLISPLIKVYAMKSGFSKIEEFTPKSFQNKYDLEVNQFLDLKSLKGDASDNLPGVAGVGEKTAYNLLKKYKTLDSIYDNIDTISGSIKNKLILGKESAYLTRQLAEIIVDVPLKLDYKTAEANRYDPSEVKRILEKYEFFSLLRKFEKMFGPINTNQTDLFSIKTDESKYKCLTSQDNIACDSVVVLSDNKFYLATSKDCIFYIKDEDLDSFFNKIKTNKIITLDIKELLYALNKKNINFNNKANYYDIRQASFLIENREDFNLQSSLWNEFNIDTKVSILWQKFKEQMIFFEKNKKLLSIALDFDFPLAIVLFKIENKGIKLDKKVLFDIESSFNKQIQSLEKEIHSISGQEFNIASPIQLSSILFDVLKLPTKGIKKTKSGYSTGKQELDKIRDKHRIIPLIEKWRELAKLSNTYVQALPKMTDRNSILHTNFSQSITATGRLSSSSPNLQNIPIRTKLGRSIRRAFVVSDKNNIFINADYSQFELRLAAVLSGDQDMIDDFNKGVDIHTKTASLIFDISSDKVSKEQRQVAKTINFGVLYGMSARRLSMETGMSFSDSQKFIDNYFEIRKPLKEYLDLILLHAQKKGYVETFFGRRRLTPDIFSTNFIVRENAKRAAINMPIQGTEADIMKRAMIKIDHEIGDLGWQVLQVHDSILIETTEDNKDKVAKIVETVMVNIAPELPIKLDVAISTGKDWSNI